LAKKNARQISPPQSEKTAQEIIKMIRGNVGVLLFRNTRAFERVLLGRLATEGFGDLRRRHSALAGHMRFEGIRTTDLAEAAGMSKQAVGMLVTELETMGYVERVADPIDTRAKLVRFTKRGNKFLSALGRLMPEVEAEMAGIVGDVDFKTLKRALERFAASSDI
jgi:DNA-binding MarR family transcriptional regulator